MSRAYKTLKGDHFLVTHTVGNGGIRLDQFLMKRYRSRSREKLKRAIDSGAITIVRNEPHHTMGKIKPSFVLRYGDVVKILSRRKREPDVDFNYKVLFEDAHMIVIDKPANLPVHPAGKYFFHTLLVHLKTNGFQNELEAERKYFLAHRIDKETSGILVLAKTPEMASAMNGLFARRETEKTYLAVVHGVPKENEFTVDVALAKIPGSAVGLKMHPVPEEQGGAHAITSFKVLATAGGKFTLLECYPKTGRQHQIRAHADHAGHPLVGDKIYGLSDEIAVKLIERYRIKEEKANASPEPIEEEVEIETETMDDFQESEEQSESTVQFEIPGPTLDMPAELESILLLPRHALHASQLKFTHPVTGQKMHFQSELPADLLKFFQSRK